MMLSSFIKPYSNRIYKHTASVRHKGKVIAFAQDGERHIYYAVLDLDNPEVTSPLDVNFWPENPNELIFPDEITEVGVGVADQTLLPTVKKGSRMPVASGTRVRAEEKDLFLSTTARLTELVPFQVLSNGRYVYLFRQAIAADHADMVFKSDGDGNQVQDDKGDPVPIVDGTMLLDRFVLAGDTLQTKMEVRYQRSRSKNRPQNRKDSLGAKDMEEKPFYEPTQELRFVSGLLEGRFHALLLPTQIPDVHRWQIFSYNRHTTAIDAFNIEASDDGLFNTRGSQPSTREGHAESALRFDGQNDHVRLEKGIALGATFTQELWIRPIRAEANTIGPLGQRLIGGDDVRRNDGPLSVWTVQHRALRIGFGDGSKWYETVTGKLLQLEAWNHVAIVFDGTFLRIYLNGEERSRVKAATVYIDGEEQEESEPLKDKEPAATEIRFLGADSGSFRGTIDDVRFWNRARSIDEVRADMSRRLAGQEPGLVGYWRFDEASGDVIYDQTDSDNRGVRSGGTWVTSDAPVGVSSGLNRSSLRLAGRSIESGMTALLYFHQEKQEVGYAGESKPVKHNARVMLTVATKGNNSENRELAALDFGVSAAGRLAQTPDNMELRVIEPPRQDGETIEEKLNRVTTLGQRVIELGADVVNLADDIVDLNHAIDVVGDAVNGRRYQPDIRNGDLNYLNDKIVALQNARATVAQKGSVVRHLKWLLRTARIWVYEHVNYRGRRLSYGIGWVGYTTLSKRGFNDLISSISIPEPLQVTVYEHAAFKGKRKNHRKTVSWVGHDWNDIISSFKISEDPAFSAKIRDAETATNEASERVNALVIELNAELAKLRQLLAAREQERQAKARELTSKRSELENLRVFLNEGVVVSMPLVHTDPFGLSITGGLLAFAWTNDSPMLFDSATGKLALYFRGTDDQFFVSYYSTLTQRAQYKLVNDRAQDCILCTARSSASEMDGLTIDVTQETDEGRCSVTLNGVGIEETWTQVPRDPILFSRVLNGQAGERAFVGSGSIETDEGRVERLIIPSGLKRSLDAGSTLVVDGRRLAVRETVSKGTREVLVDSSALDVPTGAHPVFFIEYDYTVNAKVNKVPASLESGSLLVRSASLEERHLIQVGQSLSSGSTINSQWTAAAPGFTLAFDGDKGHVRPATNDESALKRFAAPRDVTLEAWVRSGQITDDDKAQIIQHKSETSRYALGLKRQDLVSALKFDGAKDYILIPNSDALNFDGMITVEAWIRPAAFDGVRNIVAHGFRSSPQGEVFLRLAHGTYEIGSWDSVTYKATIDMPEEDKTGLNWIHLAGVYDGSAWNLYRNGELMTTADSRQGAMRVNAQWAIGARGYSQPERLFAGRIDEVRIWKRGRSQQEIRADMRRRLGGNETDLVGYWHFDEAARDYSRHQNDGVIQGTPGSAVTALSAHAPFANAGSKYVQSRHVFPAGSWSHLAAVYKQSYGLEFNGKDSYLDCGSDTTLDINRDLTIEVFLRVDSLNESCGLLSRGKIDDGTDQDVPYCLHINKSKKLVFGFEDTDHGNHELASSRNAIAIGEFARVAVTRKRETRTTERRNNSGQIIGADVDQWDDIRLYSGTTEIGYRKHDGKDAGNSNQPLEIGRTFLRGFREARLNGVVTEVRIWNTARNRDNIGSEIKGSEAGLVSWWRLEENDGNIAYDSKSTNHAKLKGGVKWVKNPDPSASKVVLFRDGINIETEEKDAADFKVPDPQFTLGALGNSTIQHYYQGELEELRVWRTARTQEQIRDNLFRRVLGEKEDLIAYYPFDAEAVGELSDHSFRGNDLNVHNATYVLSTAPIGEDTPQVRSALAGIRTPFNGLIESRPGVIEYGDMQYDVEGNLIGVLKRCYAFTQHDQWQLVTGFKVGNLATEWLGQVQFAPQLIGFIEGAPPVPSENLTGTGTVRGEFTDYNAASAIELTEAQATTYSYAASKDKGFDMSVEAKIGGILGARAEAGFGLVVETVNVENIIGAHLLFEHSLGWLEDAKSGSGFSISKLSRMELRGGVENVDGIAYPEIGRRFAPENFGFALVQSDTADVFALRLQHNNALISFQMRPNPDIPKDWNIITFPINPRYSKQGTLDGKIGFRPDQNYPNALTYSPDSSYFKPIEAYALKNRIQREEERLRTYFDQYEAGAKGRRQADVHFSQGDLAAGRALEKLPKIEKRNLVNNYVWTADGGLFAETEDAFDLQQETTGGSYQFKGMAGVYTDLTVAIGGAGIKFELDALFGGHLNLAVTKSAESESSFGMNVDLGGVEGDIYLRDDRGKIMIDRSDPLNPKRVKAVGKVDAYRFMTFYLEPQTDHFDHFFSKVVDPIWLEQSDEPNAVALREARQVEKKPPCWRIMHRCTFVSRILPPLSDAAAPPLERTMKELDIDSNYELIKLLEPFVINEISNFASFAQTIRRTLKTYHPELLPHAKSIIQYMSLYYGISEEAASLPGVTDEVLDEGAPLDPVVDAGPNSQTVEVNGELELQGTLENSRQPLENLLVTWARVSGPEQVVFSDPNNLETNAQFGERGLYVLRLTVNDGLLAISDDIRVAANREPVISAGNDQELLPREHAELSGAIEDDGLGDPTHHRDDIRIGWLQVGGPGEVDFSDDSSLRTKATFTKSGRYLLRLTVDNGSFAASDEVMVAVAARVTRDLQALYVFEEGGGTTVRDVAAVAAPLSISVPEDTDVSWVDGGLAIREPAAALMSVPITRVLDATRSSNEVSIEAWIKPAVTEQPGLARIVTCSSGPAARNFALGQRGDQFYVTFRTDTTKADGSDKALAAGRVKPDTLTHVVCTRDPSGAARLHVDGEEVAHRAIGGTFSNWQMDLSLALGNEVGNGSDNDRAWAGELDLVAIYSRALTPIEINQNFEYGANTNLSPIVVAGPDQMINLPDQATIGGTILDDRLLADQIDTKWTQAGGPSSVVFEDSNALLTTVDFSRNGRYVLRLTATEKDADGKANGLSASDEMVVIINQAPAIEAGTPQRLALSESTSLHGAIMDDGLGDDGPPDRVHVEWQQKEGPVTAHIANPLALETEVQLSEPGAYVFQLSADNGRLPPAQAETTVYVNKAPAIRATTEAVVELPDEATLVGEEIDLGLFDPDGIVSRTWSQVSGPGKVSFGDTDALSTTATFTDSGVYVLKLTVETSGEDYSLSTEAELTLTANRAPVVDAGPDLRVLLPAVAELDGTVSDDGYPDPPGFVSLQWSKRSGPGEISFSDATSAFTTARFSRGGTYELQLEARDYDDAVAVGSSVKVDVEAPPRIVDGLQVLYAFGEGEGATIRDVSDIDEPLDLVVENLSGDSKPLQWLNDGLRVAAPVLLKANGPVAKLFDAIVASNEITIEAWIKRADGIGARQSPASILTFSLDTRRRNFSLGQTSNNRYDVRLRTTETNSSGTHLRGNIRPTLQNVTATADLSHLLYTRDASGVVKFYRNGSDTRARRPAIGGSFENWGNTSGERPYQFALANELTGTRPWLGEYYLIAIYSRALDESEAQQNFLAGY